MLTVIGDTLQEALAVGLGLLGGAAALLAVGGALVGGVDVALIGAGNLEEGR